MMVYMLYMCVLYVCGMFVWCVCGMAVCMYKYVVCVSVCLYV